MKNKFLIKIATLVAIPVIMPSFLSASGCANNEFKVDPKIAAHDKDSWKHAIEYISSCGHPTIYLNTPAAYYIQQAANLFTVGSQLAIENNHTYATSGYEYNDQIYVVPSKLWNYKEDKPGSESGYFALNYNALVNSYYGYSDILSKSKAAGGTINLKLGNQMLISNLQDFNLSLDKYNPSLPDYSEVDNFIISTDVINKIMDMYEEVNPNIRFNFVVNDYCWNMFVDSRLTNPTAALTQIRMMKKMDKLYIASDGSYTWVEENAKYAKFFEKNGYKTSKEQNEIFQKLINYDRDRALEYYKTIDPMIFYNNEDYCYHFCASSQATFADCYLNKDKNLTKETTYKFSTPWLVPDSYKKLFDTLKNNFYNYLASYLGLFKYNSGAKFDKFFVGGTDANYDKTKKNLIWMLPGALRPGKSKDEVWDECSRIFLKIRENYPDDKWNFVFKAHPAMSTSDVITAVNRLIRTTKLPNNICIIDPVYPFEYMITLDQSLVSQWIEDTYHLIDPRTFDDEKPSGTIASFDMCTTSAYAAMSIFANEYGYKFDVVKKLVCADSFLITKKFEIPTYSYETGKDYSQINKQNLTNFYNPLIQTNEFPDVTKYEFFKK